MTSQDTFGLVTGSSRIFSSEPPVSLIKKTKSNLLVRKTDAIKTVKPTKCFCALEEKRLCELTTPLTNRFSDQRSLFSFSGLRITRKK